MDSVQKDIQEKIAQQRVNILKGFSETGELIEKARSGTYSDNSENRAKNRVGQQYGSKKEGGDEPKPKQNKKEDEASTKKDVKNEPSNDKLNSHLKNTPTENLKEYVKDENAEHRDLALQELKERGEDGESNNIEVDWDNAEEVKQFFADNKDIAQQFLDTVAEDVLTPPKQILQDLISKKNTHSKIDSAQAALDDLKSHTNHPDKKEQSAEEWARNSSIDELDDYLDAYDRGDETDEDKANYASMEIEARNEYGDDDDDELDALKMKLEELDEDGNYNVGYDEDTETWFWEDYKNDSYKDKFNSELEAYDNLVGELDDDSIISDLGFDVGDEYDSDTYGSVKVTDIWESNGKTWVEVKNDDIGSEEFTLDEFKAEFKIVGHDDPNREFNKPRKKGE